MDSCSLDFFLQESNKGKGRFEVTCRGDKGSEVVLDCKFDDFRDLLIKDNVTSPEQIELLHRMTGVELAIIRKLDQEALASLLYEGGFMLRKLEKNWDLILITYEMVNGVPHRREFILKRARLEDIKVYLLRYLADRTKIPSANELSKKAAKRASKKVSKAFRDKFRRTLKRCITKKRSDGKKHPLAFLVDPSTGKLYKRARGPILDDEHGINVLRAMEAAHVTSASLVRANPNVTEALMVESRYWNQVESWNESQPMAFLQRTEIYSVGGVPVSKKTLADFHRGERKVLPDGKVIYEPLISQEVYDEAIANGPVQGWTASDLDSVCR